MSTHQQYTLIIRANGTAQLVEQRTGRIVPPGEVRSIRRCRDLAGVLVEFHEKHAVLLMEDEIRHEIQQQAG